MQRYMCNEWETKNNYNYCAFGACFLTTMGTMVFSQWAQGLLIRLPFKGHNGNVPSARKPRRAHAAGVIVPLERKNEEHTIVSIVKKPLCPLWLNFSWCRRHR